MHSNELVKKGPFNQFKMVIKLSFNESRCPPSDIFCSCKTFKPLCLRKHLLLTDPQWKVQSQSNPSEECLTEVEIESRLTDFLSQLCGKMKCSQYHHSCLFFSCKKKLETKENKIEISLFVTWSYPWYAWYAGTQGGVVNNRMVSSPKIK